jgi:hypothetical protein
MIANAVDLRTYGAMGWEPRSSQKEVRVLVRVLGAYDPDG